MDARMGLTAGISTKDTVSVRCMRGGHKNACQRVWVHVQSGQLTGMLNTP